MVPHGPRRPGRRDRGHAGRHVARDARPARRGAGARPVGRRPPRAPAPRASAPRSIARPGPASPPRLPRTHAPGRGDVQSFALDIERADIALLVARGSSPFGYGFEMRRPITGRAARARAARRSRAPAGDHGPDRAGSSRPTTRPSATTGATARGRGRLPWRGSSDPDDGHHAVAGRLGRRRGRRIGRERDLPRGERAVWASSAAGSTTSRCGASGGDEALARRCARPRSGPCGPRDGGGMARRRRVEPDGRAPAVRGPRVRRSRERWLALRATARRAGAEGWRPEGTSPA